MLTPLLAAASLVFDPLVGNLRDPMELAVAPDGSLFVVEREGRILRANPATGGLFEIGRLEVTALRESAPDSPWAREDGLLGIALDPGFADNRHLYLYYSHPEQLLNRLSRFTLSQGRLDPASEQVLLDVPTDRKDRVCHQGGCLEFGPDGLLYLSTGDNTNPFESQGKAPIDDREGRDHADAMRSAGNTDDLRGKILRIRPTADGYQVPAGNLFAPGTPGTRPEIYVMGCRNPFRMSIDPRSGFLYWGEVGPDARRDDKLGPTGHDEVNQARAAGNFGWPFVIADNRPYPIVDFDTREPVADTDPSAPRNPGRRNSGLERLPPARPAFIWYSYAESGEFPELGRGGRNAMAGPTFYHDSRRKWNLLPQADDHSLVVYDWIRGAMWRARLDDEERLSGLARVADGLRHPMDLEAGPDGSWWLLEYGTNWYFNRDGRIRRVLPAGLPRLPELTVERLPAGGARVSGTDRPVQWWAGIGEGELLLGEGRTLDAFPDGTRELRAVLAMDDGRRAIGRLDLRPDSSPTLTLLLHDVPEPLAPGDRLDFSIAEDAADPLVRIRYIPPTGHDAGGPTVPAEVAELLTRHQCFACHQIDTRSVGPRYTDVALRYRDDNSARRNLLKTLRQGGSGNWGEVPMPPQVTLGESEAERVVDAILGLARGVAEVRGERRGTLEAPVDLPSDDPGGAWEISAEAPGYLPARTRIPAK